MTKNNPQEPKLTEEQEAHLRREMGMLAEIAVDEYFKRKTAERVSKLSKNTDTPSLLK